MRGQVRKKQNNYVVPAIEVLSVVPTTPLATSPTTKTTITGGASDYQGESDFWGDDYDSANGSSSSPAKATKGWQAVGSSEVNENIMSWGH